MKSALAAALVALAVTGCASQIQAVDAYQDAAMVSLRATEDLNIKAWKANACATPLSATLRHPEIVPALRELCLPPSANSSPALLLDPPK